jgi:hypothetical protein
MVLRTITRRDRVLRPLSLHHRPHPPEAIRNIHHCPVLSLIHIYTRILLRLLHLISRDIIPRVNIRLPRSGKVMIRLRIPLVAQELKWVMIRLFNTRLPARIASTVPRLVRMITILKSMNIAVVTETLILMPMVRV